MSEQQAQFLRDLVESLKKPEPLHYADQTRYASLIEKAFPEVFKPT